MKKIYMAPLTEVVKVNAEKMLSGSDQVGQGGPFSGGSGDIQGKDDEEYGDLW